jgi:hypothetical protein
MRNQYSNDAAGFLPLNKLIAPERKTLWAEERAKSAPSRRSVKLGDVF